MRCQGGKFRELVEGALGVVRQKTNEVVSLVHANSYQPTRSNYPTLYITQVELVKTYCKWSLLSWSHLLDQYLPSGQLLSLTIRKEFIHRKLIQKLGQKHTKLLQLPKHCCCWWHMQQFSYRIFWVDKIKYYVIKMICIFWNGHVIYVDNMEKIINKEILFCARQHAELTNTFSAKCVP